MFTMNREGASSWEELDLCAPFSRALGPSKIATIRVELTQTKNTYVYVTMNKGSASSWISRTVRPVQ